MAQKYVRIHFVGETERLLLALKDNHNIIGGNLKIGQANTIKSFDIRHRKTLMCVGNLALKEELALAVDEINVQTVITNIEHLQKFNEWYGKIYKTLYTEAHLSKYGESFVDIAWGLRCEPLGFSTKSKTPCIGSVDVNKAYTHLLANEMKQVPVFDNFCVFTEFAWDGVVEKLDDHTLYVVKRIEGKKYSTAKSIILDKSHNMYYGKILKEAVSLVRTLEFEVLSRCEPISVVAADFSAGVKELYDKERGLNVVQKKFLVNCIMGCLDQFRRTTRTAEFYETEWEALANNKEDYFKPTVLSVPGDAWIDEDKMVSDQDYLNKLDEIISGERETESRGEREMLGGLVGEIESMQQSVQGLALSDEDKDKIQHFYWSWQMFALHEWHEQTSGENDDDDEDEDERRFDVQLDKDMESCIQKHEDAESWRTYTTDQLKEERCLWILQTKRTTSLMKDGFLPISLLKYQLQRIVVLRMWRELEKSGLIPIGVKTDAIFVAREETDEEIDEKREKRLAKKAEKAEKQKKLEEMVRKRKKWEEEDKKRKSILLRKGETLGVKSETA